MAYQNDLVLCVLHGGSPVREINGQVSIPFHSEYKVRLKNKHAYLRAKARVWIDGRKVSNLGDFILKPGETLDLERFLDESLSAGNSFRFVPLSARKVNDPTDPANGIIRVEFYRESDFLNNWNFITTKPSPYPAYPWGGGPDPRWRDNTGREFNPHLAHNTCSSQTIGSSGARTSIKYSAARATAGATVEGNISNQSFASGTDFQTEFFPTVLTLRLRGVSKQTEPQLTLVKKKETVITKKERFCSSCGKRRHRASDKFCGRCGQSFKVS